jgi:hypothetical protein
MFCWPLNIDSCELHFWTMVGDARLRTDIPTGTRVGRLEGL